MTPDNMCKCGKHKFSWEDECYACKVKNYNAKIKEDILAGEVKSTDCESEIICPWCGEIYEIEDNYDLYQDGEHEVECGACDRKFIVTVNVSYSYDTSRVAESEAKK